MKNLVILILAFSSLNAFADITEIYQTRIARGYDLVQADAKFYMDQVTGQGYAKLNVTETYYRYSPPTSRCDQYGCHTVPGHRIPTTRTILRETIEIEGLTITDNLITFSHNHKEINCGKLGRSRVLRRPTIYLTGNCKLNTYIRHDLLTLDLITK